MNVGPYTCPHCGTAHAVPPKWCRCRPFPMDEPSVTVSLARVDPGLTADQDDLALDYGLPDEALLRDRVVIHRDVGPSYAPLEDDAPQEPDSSDLCGWIDWYARDTPRRATVAGSTTGLVLVTESHSPGVETLGELRCTVQDLTPEQFEHLLRLARAGDPA